MPLLLTNETTKTIIDVAEVDRLRGEVLSCRVQAVRKGSSVEVRQAGHINRSMY